MKKNTARKQALALTAFALAATLALLGGLGWFWYRQLSSADVQVRVDAPILTTYHAQNDITYCSPDGTDLRLDLFIPDNKERTFPLLVYIHGGGWYTGSKDTAAIQQYIPEVARLGYVVASIDYRLAPAHTFPAQVEDVKCAIRYLRAHASTYNIDSSNVGVLGESAGGYLAAFAGATGDNQTYKTAEHANQSDAVQAVVDLFGPSTFTDTQASPAAIRMARNFLGSANPRVASIPTHIGPNMPPTLIVHGTDDSVVPYRQSQTLHNSLQASGIPSTLVPVEHAQHGLSASQGQTIKPSLSTIRQDITAFLARYLKD
jgi:acetyl esterase/lipase